MASKNALSIRAKTVGSVGTIKVTSPVPTSRRTHIPCPRVVLRSIATNVTGSTTSSPNRRRTAGWGPRLACVPSRPPALRSNSRSISVAPSSATTRSISAFCSSCPRERARRISSLPSQRSPRGFTSTIIRRIRRHCLIQKYRRHPTCYSKGSIWSRLAPPPTAFILKPNTR